MLKLGEKKAELSIKPIFISRANHQSIIPLVKAHCLCRYTFSTQERKETPSTHKEMLNSVCTFDSFCIVFIHGHFETSAIKEYGNTFGQYEQHTRGDGLHKIIDLCRIFERRTNLFKFCFFDCFFA